MTEEQLNTQLADFFGKLTNHFDARLDNLEGRLGERIDRVQTTVDSIAKRLDTFEQEQTIINARTDSKLDQLAEATSIKWATE